MKSLILIFSLLLSLNSFAVTAIKEGETAPHSGFIFSKEEEKSIRKIKTERDLLKKLTFKQDAKIEIQKERIELYKERLDDSKLSGFGKAIYFIGGVLATGMSVYLAGKLVRN